MLKTNMNVIKTGELMILVVEDLKFRDSVRDRNAFKAGSSPTSKGSKSCATFS